MKMHDTERPEDDSAAEQAAEMELENMIAARRRAREAASEQPARLAEGDNAACQTKN